MRGFWAVLTLLAALFCAPALAGPADYVFEYRLVEEDGREIVATCRGRRRCVLDEGLRGQVRFAVEVDVTAVGISVGVISEVANLGVRDVSRWDWRNLLTRGPGRWIAVAELPATLRIVRYERGPPCGRLLCENTERPAGLGTLVIRPMPLVSVSLEDRT